MSKQANLSYPTMRNKMDDLIEKNQQAKKRHYPKFVIIYKPETIKFTALSTKNQNINP